MLEHKYIKICLDYIASKMEWNEVDKWTHFHYTKLSEELLNATGTSISSDTLKRLSGKKRTTSAYTPQAETKQSLARFLGYSSWDDFMSAQETVTKDVDIQSINTIKNKPLQKPLKISILLLLLFSIFVAVFWFNRASLVQGKLMIDNPDGDDPHTLMARYTFSGVIIGNVYLDWGYEQAYITYEDKKPKKLIKNTGVVNQCYFVPGWYTIRLIYGTKTLDSAHVHITSANQWRSYIILPEKNDIMILTTSSGTNSGFSFNKKVIENRGFKESDNYWTELRLIKNTGLRANNFEWKVDLKNAAKDGAIVCNDIVAEVLLENSTIKIHFVQPGCTLFSEIILPHKKLKGNTADLSFLGIDFEDFKKLKIRANNNKITFWIDDRLIYEDIIQNNTVIKGFVLKFKGCGAAKNISISSIQ